MLSVSVYFGIFLIVCMVSCRKSEYSKPSLLPYSHLLSGQSDCTQSVEFRTIKQDSILGSETSVNLAGSLNDPDLGTTRAGFFTQVLLPGSNASFGASPVLDSAVLTLAYDGYYGDTLSGQCLDVFEATEAITPGSSFHTDKVFAHGDQIGSIHYTPRPTDSVSVAGSVLPPHLRIRLYDYFGSRLINYSASCLSDNVAFTSCFKGLYITASCNPTGAGAIVAFNLLSTQSKLTMYYNHGSSFDFIFNETCGRVNHFDHGYSGTAVEPQIAATSGSYSYGYLQGGSGTGIHLTFPDIQRIKDSGSVVVNQAILTIPVPDGYHRETYPVPSKLLLSMVDSSGGNQVTPDQMVSASYFGGTYSSALDSYEFNIAKYVQGVIDGTLPDQGMNLLPSGSAVSPARIVVGSSKVAKGVSLKIKYTLY